MSGLSSSRILSSTSRICGIMNRMGSNTGTNMQAMIAGGATGSLSISSWRRQPRLSYRGLLACAAARRRHLAVRDHNGCLVLRVLRTGSTADQLSPVIVTL